MKVLSGRNFGPNRRRYTKDIFEKWIFGSHDFQLFPASKHGPRPHSARARHGQIFFGTRFHFVNLPRIYNEICSSDRTKLISCKKMIDIRVSFLTFRTGLRQITYNKCWNAFFTADGKEKEISHEHVSFPGRKTTGWATVLIPLRTAGNSNA